MLYFHYFSFDMANTQRLQPHAIFLLIHNTTGFRLTLSFAFCHILNMRSIVFVCFWQFMTFHSREKRTQTWKTPVLYEIFGWYDCVVLEMLRNSYWGFYFCCYPYYSRITPFIILEDVIEDWSPSFCSLQRFLGPLLSGELCPRGRVKSEAKISV